MRKYLIALSLFTVLYGCSAPVANQTDGTNINQNQSIYEVAKTISVGKTPHGIGAINGFVYNSNVGEGTISVIDAEKSEVIKTITLENGTPGYIKAFHSGNYILATDTKKGELLAIDSTDHSIKAAVSIGSKPDKIVISEDDKTVAVSFTAENKITVLTTDFSNGITFTKKDITTDKVAEGTAHRSVALFDNLIAVPNSGENNLNLISLTDNSIKQVKDGNSPEVIALTETGGKKVLLIGNKASNTVSVYDIVSGEKQTMDSVGLTPTDVALAEGLNKAFITMAGSDEVAVVDYSKKELLQKIKVGKRPVHIYNFNNDIWVSNDSGDSVTIIDPVSLAVKQTVQVGKGHHKMAFSKNKVFVSNIASNDISVVTKK